MQGKKKEMRDKNASKEIEVDKAVRKNASRAEGIREQTLRAKAKRQWEENDWVGRERGTRENKEKKCNVSGEREQRGREEIAGRESRAIATDER